jgi:Zn-dependent M28 family amino/carboxypeptidase
MNPGETVIMTAVRPRTRRRARLAASVAVLALAGTGLAATAGPAQAADNTKLGRKLAKEITVDGVNRHLIAFQRFADANGKTRLAGTPGQALSATYVHDKLAAAGLDVSYQDFEFPFFQQLGDEQLTRVSPEPRVFAGADTTTYTYSGSGDVTAAVVPVDLVIPATPAPSSTSGCEAADFAGFPAGSIALLQRGTCTFEIKLANATAAGASAAIIFNEGQPGRTEAFAGSLGVPQSIPVVGISYADGVEFNTLAQAGPVTARVVTNTLSEIRTTRNVIAETPGGRADNVVMAGSHLDSVAAGPGINDNGSGSAALLELGLKLADEKVKNKVRLAWWSAEELGSLGSSYYVSQLDTEQQLDISLYLNFDMIASPNWARFLYDGDNSDGVGAGSGPYGSGQIEQLFTSYFAESDQPVVGTDFDGRSDYKGFIAVGIPSGGIFTGAEGIKTAEQATLFGGTAGVAYDVCYHAACDTLGNINRTALSQNAKAIGFAVGRYALDTSDINGVGTVATKLKQRNAAAAKARTMLSRQVEPGAN